MSGCGTSTGLRRPATPVVRASIPGPLRAAWEAHGVALDDVQRWVLHPDPRVAQRAIVVPRVPSVGTPEVADTTAIAEALAWAALRHLLAAPHHLAYAVDSAGAVDRAVQTWAERAHRFGGPPVETVLARWTPDPIGPSVDQRPPDPAAAAHTLWVATQPLIEASVSAGRVVALPAGMGAQADARASVGPDGAVVDALSWRTARVRAWAPLRDVPTPDPHETARGIAQELQRLVDSPRDGSILWVAPDEVGATLRAATPQVAWVPYAHTSVLPLAPGWSAWQSPDRDDRVYEAVLLASAASRASVLALAPRLLAHTGRAGEEMRLLLACQNAPDLLQAAALREQLLAGEATTASLEAAVFALEETTRQAVAERLAGPDGVLMATFWMVSVLGINRGNAGAVAHWLAAS